MHGCHNFHFKLHVHGRMNSYRRPQVVHPCSRQKKTLVVGALVHQRRFQVHDVALDDGTHVIVVLLRHQQDIIVAGGSRWKSVRSAVRATPRRSKARYAASRSALRSGRTASACESAPFSSAEDHALVRDNQKKLPPWGVAFHHPFGAVHSTVNRHCEDGVSDKICCF